MQMTKRMLRSSTYNPLFFFPYSINGQPCDMVFTSVAGHLMELDFPENWRKWKACSPVDLYGAPVLKIVPQVLCWLSFHSSILFHSLGHWDPTLLAGDLSCLQSHWDLI